MDGDGRRRYDGLGSWPQFCERKLGSFAPVGKEAWMKLKVVLAAVLVLLGCVPRANADPVLLINGNGLLTGAHNVKVAGTLYDVTFVDGTCIDVFAGCDALSDFHFATFEDGIAAANALLGQVFVDAPAVGEFDTHPELTFGCTAPSSAVRQSPRESQGAWCLDRLPITASRLILRATSSS